MAKTLAANVDNSVFTIMMKAFLISNLDRIVYEQFVTWREDVAAKAIEFPEYAKLALATTALTDGTNATPVALSDSQHLLTPAEYGLAVQPTNLAKLQTDGLVGMAAAQAVGINQAETNNRLGFEALAASTNIILANGAASEGAIAAGDTTQEDDADDAFTDLQTTNAVAFGGPTGPAYVAIAHPHVLSDVRKLTGWENAKKYADPENLLKNEVGMFKGFRYLSTTGNDINTDAGAGTVDTYDTPYFGMNALGKAISEDPHMTLHEDGSDPHRRSLFIGWYGVFVFGIIDQNALTIIISSSAKGSN